MKEISTIKGGVAKDQRGQIRYVNDFDMSLVKRFYIIKNADTNLIRGWRAHRVEQRWFYILSGSFSIDIVAINNWIEPNPESPIINLKLDPNDMSVLHVPKGYGTSFRALEENSEVLVYADYPLSHAPMDDYTWPIDYFKNSKNTK